MKVFLIINKHAGHKDGDRALDTVVSYLKKNNCAVEYAYTGYHGHAIELAAKASTDEFDLVAAVGGDGTVNEVAQGLVGTGTLMGIIPMGSGNGLARESGIPMNLKKSAKILLRGKDRLLDVCKLNDQRFFCTSGIGFDALIAEKMSNSASRGFLKYIQLVIQQVFMYKPFNVSITIDGLLIEKPVFMVSFANASQFGNNAFIAPAASMTDGLIDVVVVKKFSKIWMPFFGIALFTNLMSKIPFVDFYKAKRVELKSGDTSYYHFDGEPGHLITPASITVDAEKIWLRCGK